MTSVKWIGLFLFLTTIINPAPAIIRVAVASDNGNEPSYVTNTVNAANEDPDITASQVSASQIRANALDNYDVFVVPGGWPFSTSTALGDEGCRKVAAFVAAGGGYIGSAIRTCSSWPPGLNTMTGTGGG
jgi:hypothetical protein